MNPHYTSPEETKEAIRVKAEGIKAARKELAINAAMLSIEKADLAITMVNARKAKASAKVAALMGKPVI